ncbi:MAG: hypothetical protein KDA80_05780 [Planctomycetaceae bacterium]|nr:hypothetical protein [Planctomycetaceae bacterium]
MPIKATFLACFLVSTACLADELDLARLPALIEQLGDQDARVRATACLAKQHSMLRFLTAGCPG